LRPPTSTGTAARTCWRSAMVAALAAAWSTSSIRPAARSRWAGGGPSRMRGASSRPF